MKNTLKTLKLATATAAFALTSGMAMASDDYKKDEPKKGDGYEHKQPKGDDGYKPKPTPAPTPTPTPAPAPAPAPAPTPTPTPTYDTTNHLESKSAASAVTGPVIVKSTVAVKTGDVKTGDMKTDVKTGDVKTGDVKTDVKTGDVKTDVKAAGGSVGTVAPVQETKITTVNNNKTINGGSLNITAAAGAVSGCLTVTGKTGGFNFITGAGGAGVGGSNQEAVYSKDCGTMQVAQTLMTSSDIRMVASGVQMAATVSPAVQAGVDSAKELMKKFKEANPDAPPQTAADILFGERLDSPVQKPAAPAAPSTSVTVNVAAPSANATALAVAADDDKDEGPAMCEPKEAPKKPVVPSTGKKKAYKPCK